MQTTLQEYKQFLHKHFNGLRLRKPLFYNWDFGLRFDLQTGEKYNSSRQILDENGNVIPHKGNTDSDDYFEAVEKRASTIFQTAFNASDTVFLVFVDYKYKKRKIRHSNYLFRQIEDFKKSDLSYTKEKQLYEPGSKFDIRNVAILKLSASRINHKNIFMAIGNSDFPPRQPRLDNNGFLTSKEVYLINIEKELIFHMYDDRGLDLIASNKETLRPIYKEHNNWILNYDRKEIDKLFV